MPFSYHVCVNQGARFHVQCFYAKYFQFPLFNRLLGNEWEAHVNCQEVVRARLADTEAAGTVTAAIHQVHHHDVDPE